jgi:PPP family 3-phenylpropionic acid transporter
MAITPFIRFLSPFALSKKQIDAKLFNIGLIGSFACIVVAPFFITYFWLFFGLFFIFSIFWTIGLPFIDALAMEQIGKEKYGKIRLFGSIGFALCSLAIGQLLLSSFALWFCYALLYAIAVIVGIKISKQYNLHFKEQFHSNAKINIINSWQFWFSIFAFQLSFGPFYAFYSIYSLEHGFSNADISYLWAFGVFCEILMFWLQGSIVKKYSPQILFFVATIAAIPRWLIVWLYPDSLFLAFVAQSFHALNLALYMTAVFALLANRYENLRLAKLFFYGFGYGLGGFIGSIVGGKIYGVHIFAFSAICAIIATIVLIKPTKQFKLKV